MSSVIALHGNCSSTFPENDLVPASQSRSIVSIETLATITVSRDLAVQLIGSDAGRRRRHKPHSAMTKGATAAEVAAVEAFMEPFLVHEINRVEKTEKTIASSHTGEATIEQATALKGFCQRFANSLRVHLSKEGVNDRHYRSIQRLDQALDVISQINVAFNFPVDADESIQDCADELFAQAMYLRIQLHGYYEHCTRMIYSDSNGGTLPSPAPQLSELMQLLDSFVDDEE